MSIISCTSPRPSAQNLAHLQRDQRAQVLFVRAQLVADFAHDFAALGRRHHAPFEEGLGRARHHGFVIGGACHAYAGQRFAGGGAEGDQFAAGRFGDPIAMAGAGIDGFDVEFFKNSGTTRFAVGHTLILAFRSSSGMAGHRRVCEQAEREKAVKEAMWRKISVPRRQRSDDVTVQPTTEPRNSSSARQLHSPLLPRLPGLRSGEEYASTYRGGMSPR